jgi:hypothetical protein
VLRFDGVRWTLLFETPRVMASSDAFDPLGLQIPPRKESLPTPWWVEAHPSYAGQGLGVDELIFTGRLLGHETTSCSDDLRTEAG